MLEAIAPNFRDDRIAEARSLAEASICAEFVTVFTVDYRDYVHKFALSQSSFVYYQRTTSRRGPPGYFKMTPMFRLTIIACLAAGLGACNSGSSSDTGADNDTIADDGIGIDSDDISDDISDSVNTDPDNPNVGTTGSASTTGTIPELDPTAGIIPAPAADDPFGLLLEIDEEEPVAGGGPTQPKNLRVDLLSNNWSSINWAPANDDVGVVEYRIYRSDGHVYTMREDTTSDNAGTQAEFNEQWATTSFMDCNYTRFFDSIHNCSLYNPQPGDTFSYEVTAVDADGNESAPSDPITITYHMDQNAPVPLYADRFLDDSNFAQNHDLSSPDHFLDEFTVIFEDEFNGSEINDELWNTQLLWGDEIIINNEQQYFVNTQQDPDFGYDPFKLDDSILSIEAIPVPDDLVANLPEACDIENEFRPRCQFLSGALATQDKFNMTFGYLEARIKTGGISGALSSFYLYHRYKGEGAELNAPEIDVIEYLGDNPFGDEDAFQTYHFDDVTTGLTRSSPTMNYENPEGALYSDEFHTYSVLWEPQLVIWYIDGEEVKRLSGPMVGARAMNIVTYLVAGSGWAPTPDEAGEYPITMQIDYIRAYQRDHFIGNGLYPQLDIGN